MHTFEQKCTSNAPEKPKQPGERQGKYTPLAYFDSPQLRGYSNAAKDSILTAEAIHLDSHHSTLLNKMHLSTLRKPRKQGVDKDPA
jgi:hypothetical protein